MPWSRVQANSSVTRAAHTASYIPAINSVLFIGGRNQMDPHAVPFAILDLDRLVWQNTHVSIHGAFASRRNHTVCPVFLANPANYQSSTISPSPLPLNLRYDQHGNNTHVSNESDRLIQEKIGVRGFVLVGSLLVFGGKSHYPLNDSICIDIHASPNQSNDNSHDIDSANHNYNVEIQCLFMRPIGHIPDARFCHSASFHHKSRRMYIFGGVVDMQASDGLYYLDLDKWFWRSLSGGRTGRQDNGHNEHGPTPRYFHSSCFIGDDELLILGGRNTQGTRFNDAWVWNININKWQELELPYGFSGRVASVITEISVGCAILTGGMDKHGEAAETWVLYYDQESQHFEGEHVPDLDLLTEDNTTIQDFNNTNSNSEINGNGEFAPGIGQRNHNTFNYNSSRFNSNNLRISHYKPWKSYRPVFRTAASLICLDGVIGDLNRRRRVLLMGGYRPQHQYPFLSDVWTTDVSGFCTPFKKDVENLWNKAQI